MYSALKIRNIIHILKNSKNIYKTLFYTIPAMQQIGNFGYPFIVNGPSRFTKQTNIGKNCHFNGLRIDGNGNVAIGSNFHSGPQCIILTRNHNYDTGKSLPYDNTYTVGNVEIGDNVWIGLRVIILANTRIGEGVIIQAGSCVVSDIPDYAIAGGHPAKIFKYRDVDHYKKLKNKNKHFEQT